MPKKGYKQTKEHIAAISVGTKKALADPEVKARHIAGGKKAQNRPDVKARNSISQIKRYKDPKEHEKTSLSGKKRFEDLKEHEKLSIAQIIAQNRPDVKANRSAASFGKDNPCWRGGITPLYNLLHNGDVYKQWRTDVFIRDNYACQKCGDNSGGNLEAHHIKPFMVIFLENNITIYEEGLNCEEFWDINNGVTLCEECHKKEKALTMKLIKKVENKNIFVE